VGEGGNVMTIPASGDSEKMDAQPQRERAPKVNVEGEDRNQGRRSWAVHI
jgi:hypothetical protein